MRLEARFARRHVAKATALFLWLLLCAGVIAVVAMTWHPWVHPWTGITH
jgi:hypothetical protein